VPVAVTEKAAVCPAFTVKLAGCVVIDGATAAAPATLSVAVLLVALPALLLTTTLNSALLSEAVVGGVV
jgi:hypothetical protein